VGELRYFPEGAFKPVLAQTVRAGRTTDSLFEQARNIRLHSTTVRFGLARERGLNLRVRCQR
jgi:hypothetical protein